MIPVFFLTLSSEWPLRSFTEVFLVTSPVSKVMSSIDDLFQLPAPAALKRGMNRGKWPYKHGNLAEDMEQFPNLDLGPG